MKTYLDQVRFILENGITIPSEDERTKTGTLSVFGLNAYGLPSLYNMEHTHPVVTDKYTHLRGVVTELLWFISGQTNIQPLLREKCRIWSQWPHQKFVQETGEAVSLAEFEQRVLDDDAFALRYGDIGPCYGKQWRKWEDPEKGTVHDQLQTIIQTLKTDPCNRGLIMSGWNVADLSKMALRPCHTLYQFRGTPDGYLDLILYQRSADMFLGVPFNVASAALLNRMVAQCAGLKARNLIHYLGDAHIYLNHIEQTQKMLAQGQGKQPILHLDPSITDIDGFTSASVRFEGYEHGGKIPAPVAV